MKLDSKALAITLALLWGGAVFLVAALHSIWPSYGRAFLNLVASIYPGFHPGGMGAAIIGMLYALLDGAVCGLLVAWLYNRLCSRPATG